jgi:hypothetical protein
MASPQRSVGKLRTSVVRRVGQLAFLASCAINAMRNFSDTLEFTS